MVHTAHGVRTPLDVLSAATARAGEHLGLAPLGQLIEGAPADLIGVRGNPLEQFKPLEYPDLVVSGSVTIVGPAGHCSTRRCVPHRPVQAARRPTRRRCSRSPAGRTGSSHRAGR
jgi:cytosine/adenosine deaminase-related metal-dependent hydrolase